MRFKLPVLLVALAVVLAPTFAACAGDDDDDAGGNAEATSTEQAQGNEATPAKQEETPAGDGGDVESGDLGDDPCARISGSDVREITGDDFREGTRDNSTCKFESQTGSSVTVVMDYVGGGASLTFTDNIDDELRGFEEVEGAGERAAWSDKFNELDVLWDGYIITVTVFHLVNEDDAMLQEQAIAVAARVLD